MQFIHFQSTGTKMDQSIFDFSSNMNFCNRAIALNSNQKSPQSEYNGEEREKHNFHEHERQDGQDYQSKNDNSTQHQSNSQCNFVSLDGSNKQQSISDHVDCKDDGGNYTNDYIQTPEPRGPVTSDIIGILQNVNVNENENKESRRVSISLYEPIAEPVGQ